MPGEGKVMLGEGNVMLGEGKVIVWRRQRDNLTRPTHR